MCVNIKKIKLMAATFSNSIFKTSNLLKKNSPRTWKCQSLSSDFKRKPTQNKHYFGIHLCSDSVVLSAKIDFQYYYFCHLSFYFIGTTKQTGKKTTLFWVISSANNVDEEFCSKAAIFYFSSRQTAHRHMFCPFC